MKKRALPEFLNVPWGVRDVLILIAAWFGLQLLLGVVLGGLSHIVPQVAAFIDSAQAGDLAAAFALDVIDVGIGLGLVWAYLRYYRVTWQTVGWRKVGLWKSAGYLLAILVIFIVMANVALIVLQALVPGFDANQAQNNEFTQSAGSNRNLALIALVLLPPIFEETIFRGFIFPAIAKRTGVIWGAVLSSAIFGIAHGQPNLFVYTTILGLLLCFMYLRLRSIVPGILLHMLNNYLAFLSITHK